MLATLVHVPLSLVLIPRLGVRGGLAALVVSCALGTVWFVVRFHRAFAVPLGAFLVRVVLPPACVAVVAAAVAGLAGDALAGLLPGASRLHAVAMLAGGGLVLAAIALLALVTVRYLSIGELRELLALVSGRRRGGEAA